MLNPFATNDNVSSSSELMPSLIKFSPISVIEQGLFHALRRAFEFEGELLGVRRRSLSFCEIVRVLATLH